MLLLLFQAGNHRYAIDSNRVVEILPLMKVRNIPLTHPGLMGVFDYRGIPLPVVDICLILTHIPARPLFSTRTIVVKYSNPESISQEHLLGIVAEKVTQTWRADASHFIDTGIAPKDAPYLGKVISNHKELIQLVPVEKILPEAITSTLFQNVSKQ